LRNRGHISKRRSPWVPSCSNVPRREVRYRLASKPSQSAFAVFRKRGWWSTVQSVSNFTERGFGLILKLRLPRLSCRDLVRTNETCSPILEYIGEGLGGMALPSAAEFLECHPLSSPKTPQTYQLDNYQLELCESAFRQAWSEIVPRSRQLPKNDETRLQDEISQRLWAHAYRTDRRHCGAS
jgi:hypothetical protein